MNFQWLYRASFYVMLFLATLVLSIDATDDNKFAMLYPLAVGAAGVLAFLTVDRDPRLALSRGLASLLAFGSAGLSILEYELDPNLFLLAAAHWLVYLQLVKMFLPKTVEDDWFLFLLGLVQVVVGGVMSQSDQVGMALFGWVIVSLWVLALFTLHREAGRVKTPEGVTVTPPLDRKEPYPGLVSWSFLFATGRVALTTLALGGIIFLAMPRRSIMGSSQRGDAMGRHLTGFDDEVKLGQLGEILENDSVVMTVEMYDEETKRKLPPSRDEQHFRGVTLARYVRGRWRRQSTVNGSFALDQPNRPREPRRTRQTIKLEPTDSSVLFSMRPVLSASASNRRYTPEFNPLDGTIFRADTRTVALEYEVISSADTLQPQPGEIAPSGDRLRELVDMPIALKQKLRSIALPLVEKIPPSAVADRARKLESYLLDTKVFTYTLQQDVGDPNLDPVEDFLINRKQGHCEYFASALALLLRSIDIPARMVNGFKGGDYNDITGVLTVRQKHAHSWVEAYLGRTPGRENRQLPIWITLDPTPPNERDESVAKVGGIPASFRTFTDLVRYVWIFYIVGFNEERQRRFLYQPVSDLIREARRGFNIMGTAIMNAVRWVFDFQKTSFFSMRGLLAILLLVLTISVIVFTGRWILLKLWRWWRGHRHDVDGLQQGVAFQRRLVQLLSEYGLERPAAETPREFARRAATFLAGKGSGTEIVADVPPLVVDAFYRIRFGNAELSTDELAHVESRLDALEHSLRPA